jgi:hypothetical protein
LWHLCDPGLFGALPEVGSIHLYELDGHSLSPQVSFKFAGEVGKLQAVKCVTLGGHADGFPVFIASLAAFWRSFVFCGRKIPDGINTSPNTEKRKFYDISNVIRSTPPGSERLENPRRDDFHDACFDLDHGNRDGPLILQAL